MNIRQFVTAKTFPLDKETGKFQSEPAEEAFEEATQQLGLLVTREAFRSILQAYECAHDKCRMRYVKDLKEKEKLI